MSHSMSFLIWHRVDQKRTTFDGYKSASRFQWMHLERLRVYVDA
jgi:hypothetical protein